VPHGISVFPVSSEGTPHLVACYDTQGDEEDGAAEIFEIIRLLSCVPLMVMEGRGVMEMGAC
jgi:hypothetical protein